MTKTELEQLNREISELRQPYPGPGKRMEQRKGKYHDPQHGANWHCYSVGRFEDGNFDYSPRNWTGDENASAVLLEEIMAGQPEQDLHMEHMKGSGWSVLTCYVDSNYGGDWNDTLAQHADRKTAIALAWKNWKAGKQS